MKVAVVEDSDLAREGLVSMLSDYVDINVIWSADHPDTAIGRLNDEPADVLFLDIHMPGKSGFDLLANLNYSPLIVFTTAYSEYAVRSFDFNTVDYLLKPVSRERLNQAILKLRKHLAVLNGTGAEDAGNQQVLELTSRLLIKDKDACHLVELQDIWYFESCKNEVRAFFGVHKAFLKRSMGHIEQRLPGATFFRANRQYIVNLRAVKSIERSVSDGFCLTMNDGTEIEVSRRRANLLLELLRI